MTVAIASARPLYLEGPAGPIFGLFHPPLEGVAPRETAVLIVPPWGWDETASYAGRRAWADDLAEAGHPTLRIDLPGTGESAGTAADPGLVAAWSDAITAAAAWLAGVPGVSRVAAIGLGLGGLLTAAAIARGAGIDDLVLWSAPVRGRTFVREQRAFSALQDTRLGVDGASATDGLPEGWLESGGFVLSAETIADLGSLEMATMSFAGLSRALLLERDGIANDGALEAQLRATGVDVTTAPGPGWTSLVFHPEQYDPPVRVFGEVAAWLANASPSGAQTTGIAAPPVVDRSALLEGGVRIRESPIRIEQPFGTLFGVLGEPVDGRVSAVTAVFLNAGAVRRIGPNRLWVETSRRWNARGIATIRVDLEGIGDADGDPGRYRDVGNFYTPEVGRHVGSVVNELERRGLGPRFVLIGLCAGGYWAFHAGAADPRVVEAVILNPRAMIWDPDLLARRDAKAVRRLIEPALWDRVVHGQVPATRVVDISRAMVRTATSAATTRLRRIRSDQPMPSAAAQAEGLLDALREHGTRVVLAFADDEPVHDELEADGLLARLGRWPNVVLVHLPGRDHTLRPIVAQRAYHELLEGELDRLTDAGRG
jgi:alpha-beta hydrolase superfamily lysophospholipase